MKKLEKALLKRALGYTSEDVVEEYGVTDDGFCLTKKKVTKKHVPPDLAAIKACMDISGEDGLKEMSLDELIEERNRLLSELEKIKSKESKDGNQQTEGKKGKVRRSGV